MLDVPAWRDGRYGQGAAAVGAVLLPAGKMDRLLHKDNGAGRFPHNMADPDVPMPVRQTLAEMFARVDLARHEHYHLGHALRRHVNVSDNYLSDRLRNGTLEDDGTRSPNPPSAASAWNDIETANRVVTDVLRQHEVAVRAFATGTDRSMKMEKLMTEDLGRVLRSNSGGPEWSIASTAVIWLRKDQNCSVFIETAYVA